LVFSSTRKTKNVKYFGACTLILKAFKEYSSHDIVPSRGASASSCQSLIEKNTIALLAQEITFLFAFLLQGRFPV
jgi:hypothetical protein